LPTEREEGGAILEIGGREGWGGRGGEEEKEKGYQGKKGLPEG